MTDRIVSVPLATRELPEDVKVPAARISDSTESGRALLTGADAAAQRESLGLGTAAVTDAGEYATAAQGAKADATEVEQVTLAAPLVYALPTGLPSGVVHRVTFTQDASGGHAVTYGGNAVTVALTAGASTTVELHPVGSGFVVCYPVTNLDAQVSALAEDGGSALGGYLSSTYVQPGELGNAAGRNVGTAAGTVAAGDDSRIVGAQPKATAAHEVRVFGDKAGIFPNVDTGRRRLVFPSNAAQSGVGLSIDGKTYVFTNTIVDLTSINMATSLMSLLFRLSDKTWSLVAASSGFDASQYVQMGLIRYDWSTPKNIVSIDLRFPFLVNGNRVPIMATENPNIRVLGHRGWLASAPENTAAAFRMAKVMGLIWMEGDVRASSDGELVIIHDTSVNRTSNSTGNVAEMTLTQLKALDFGSWKSAAYAGEKILTFKEWITLCKKINLRPYIHNSTGTAAAMVPIVRNLGMLDRVVWSSHDLTWLAAIKALLPDAELSVQLYQSGNYTTAWLDANVIPLKTAANKVEFFGQYEYMTEALSNHCVANSIGVGVWNLATPAAIHQVAEWGTSTFCISEANAGFANEMDVTAILATA